MPKLNENRKGVSDSDAASSRVIGISILIFLFVLFAPAWLSAQESGDDPTEPIETSHESDLSGSETEDAVQGSAIEGEDAVEPSIIGDGESFQLSPVETEPEIIFDLSAGETEPDVQPEDNDFFILPEIETPDFGEIFDLSPAETEPTVFTRRPTDEYYEGIVSLAPIPDITRLGPLPQALKEGAEFTDVAADWIFHRKSAGITELRGHVMIIYDTMIISCDEAILDEKNQVYHFFGEGRTFVDDSDFMLECDELEIHDADDEKMIYIRGSSRLVIYAGEDKEEPGEDSTRRERINYALSRQDTKITFINAEYDYGKDIFIAHGRVRFEQTDKYAESDEFRGEGETDYVLFTGKCEFWQKDGEWLYEHKIIEYEEDPPSKGDRLVKALMSVPTTIMCDEAEADGSIGWLELRSFGGNVVFIRQDDKHAECEMLTLWYTEDEEETGREVEYPVNLLDE
ncbi:MAG TPA: hypothetical protein ENN67_02560, partial [Firmicutes bacterium]|nr:hypothetical protein [Bacillota bacterium]